jgi:probable rRNA maturation factor
MATRAARLPYGSKPRAWIEAAGAGGRGEVTVRFVGWPESRRLNRRFRGREGSTNVLAFPAASGGSPAGAELGDLVICLPLVYREAMQQGKRPLHHLAHLVVHGTLHLLGHRHDRAPAARRMENAEARILARLGFPDPYGPEHGREGAARRGQRT